MSYRVVLWTTGHVASYAGKAIVEHPNMELVGAYAWSPEKALSYLYEQAGTGFDARCVEALSRVLGREAPPLRAAV